ncbi:MAG: ABC transporter substrate-binding protein [Pseudomonadales bacterium]|nr:ABC transporter substrate-binding protein [Pseudomonadales bacterium]
MLRIVISTMLLLFIGAFSQHSFGETANSKIRPYVLQLKWFHQFQFAGYYAALEKGFYKEENLDVIIRERNIKKTPVEEVISGNADFGISDSSLILRKLAGDPIVALVVIFQISPLIIMSLEESGITSPSDLIGKRVMYQRDVDDALIMAVLNEVKGSTL